jgi:hypothetical protein
VTQAIDAEPGIETAFKLRSVPSQRGGAREGDGSLLASPVLVSLPTRASGCRGDTGCARSDWLVTGPHEVPRSESVDRVPWGTYHLKRNGDIVTACGEFAVDWHVFWGHAPNPTARQACRVCMRVMVTQAPTNDRHPEVECG